MFRVLRTDGEIRDPVSVGHLARWVGRLQSPADHRRGPLHGRRVEPELLARGARGGTEPREDRHDARARTGGRFDQGLVAPAHVDDQAGAAQRAELGRRGGQRTVIRGPRRQVDHADPVGPHRGDELGQREVAGHHLQRVRRRGRVCPTARPQADDGHDHGHAHGQHPQARSGESGGVHRPVTYKRRPVRLQSLTCQRAASPLDGRRHPHRRPGARTLRLVGPLSTRPPGRHGPGPAALGPDPRRRRRARCRPFTGPRRGHRRVGGPELRGDGTAYEHRGGRAGGHRDRSTDRSPCCAAITARSSPRSSPWPRSGRTPST